MKKKKTGAGASRLDREDRAPIGPRALFLLLLLTSFMALALWALEVRPSRSDEARQEGSALEEVRYVGSASTDPE